ncbi:response regulator transcription factor [Streptomyces parvulus]|uniref:response regulator transcription factor n=1 Tax=Streptomyces parvulus TaxID=146923 RepID=UPI0034254349
MTATDPLSKEGAASLLRRHPRIELEESPGPESVVLWVENEINEAVLTHARQSLINDGARIVLVTQTIHEKALLGIIECGLGVIVWRHQATEKRLIHAVLAASRGDGDLPADLLVRLAGQIGSLRRNTNAGADTTPSRLSPREMEIVGLLAEGLETAEIAEKISRSTRTVKYVLHHLTNRLELRNRAHIVAYAFREGYL